MVAPFAITGHCQPMPRMSLPSFAYSPTGDAGSITRVAGIEVGHCTDTRRPTGCSVVIAREGAVAGVDVRGAAPGERARTWLSLINKRSCRRGE